MCKCDLFIYFTRHIALMLSAPRRQGTIADPLVKWLLQIASIALGPFCHLPRASQFISFLIASQTIRDGLKLAINWHHSDCFEMFKVPSFMSFGSNVTNGRKNILSSVLQSVSQSLSLSLSLSVSLSLLIIHMPVRCEVNKSLPNSEANEANPAVMVCLLAQPELC